MTVTKLTLYFLFSVSVLFIVSVLCTFCFLRTDVTCADSFSWYVPLKVRFILKLERNEMYFLLGECKIMSWIFTMSFNCLD